MTPPGAVDRTGLQRRTTQVLVASQVLGGVGVASGIVVTGLLAEQVSGSTTLSGFAGTTAVLGAALAAVPLARISSRRGRRAGLATGWGVGATGAVVMLAAVALESFALLLGGALLFGFATAANLQARYAATDLATPERRGRALALVVWATTVGAVAGPNLTRPGAAVAERLSMDELAGPIVFSVVSFVLGGVLILLLLRPDPLLVAREDRGETPADRVSTRIVDSARVICASPGALLGLVSVALAHATMVAVMTMTPVHMRHEGAELRIVGFVLSIHIAGMYAFSPLVGQLVDRLGRVPVIALGQAVLLAAVLVAGRSGSSSAVVGTGLFLLGLGWSCAVVAGSTLLSESVAAPVRPGVQGTADLAMNVAGALAGAGSGIGLAYLGYGGLNAVAAVLVVPVLLLVVLGRGSRGAAAEGTNRAGGSRSRGGGADPSATVPQPRVPDSAADPSVVRSDRAPRSDAADG